jgi:hypothetical protein
MFARMRPALTLAVEIPCPVIGVPRIQVISAISAGEISGIKVCAGIMGSSLVSCITACS